jgi:hypothetical protein
MGESAALRETALYMKTKIITLAMGLRIEKTRNRNGSVQFDSICHPNQAAGKNV